MKLTRILILLLSFITILFQANPFSMKMIPIDSPHLQILPKSLTMQERDQYLVNLSLSRSFYAKKTHSSVAPDSITSSLFTSGSFFVTELFVGTGGSNYSRYMALDTFVNQTWFQCADCNPCFDIKGENVRVEDSPSYARMPLDDKRCDPRINFQGACGFEAYFGKGQAQGYLGTETFFFEDPQKQQIYFPNIAFGCGINNKDFPFSDKSNQIAGVHGLSPGPQSFINQLSNIIKGRFSYCILPKDEQDSGISTISFGDDAQITGDAQQIAMRPDAHYHLYLAGISVDGIRLPIDPTNFQLDEKDFSKGFFIDASTPYTVLVNPAYTVLKLAVISHFALYKMIPLPIGLHGYDLCFVSPPEFTKGQIYPPVTFHFIKSLGESGEVDLSFESDHIFHDLPFPIPGFCMTIMPAHDGPSIFGAFQQAGHKFLFDVNAAQLSFAPNSCKGNP